MTIEAINGAQISQEAMRNYFQTLINRFFKILPMREQGSEIDEALAIYMESLRDELLGGGSLLPEIKDDARYLSLIMILQYLIDNRDCSLRAVRREVFRAISTIDKLKSVYIRERGAL